MRTWYINNSAITIWKMAISSNKFGSWFHCQDLSTDDPYAIEQGMNWGITCLALWSTRLNVDRGTMYCVHKPNVERINRKPLKFCLRNKRFGIFWIQWCNLRGIIKKAVETTPGGGKKHSEWNRSSHSIWTQLSHEDCVGFLQPEKSTAQNSTHKLERPFEHGYAYGYWW